jgi:hypothetical protein
VKWRALDGPAPKRSVGAVWASRTRGAADMVEAKAKPSRRARAVAVGVGAKGIRDGADAGPDLFLSLTSFSSRPRRRRPSPLWLACALLLSAHTNATLKLRPDHRHLLQLAREAEQSVRRAVPRRPVLTRPQACTSAASSAAPSCSASLSTSASPPSGTAGTRACVSLFRPLCPVWRRADLRAYRNNGRTCGPSTSRRRNRRYAEPVYPSRHHIIDPHCSRRLKRP